MENIFDLVCYWVGRCVLYAFLSLILIHMISMIDKKTKFMTLFFAIVHQIFFAIRVLFRSKEYYEIRFGGMTDKEIIEIANLGTSNSNVPYFVENCILIPIQVFQFKLIIWKLRN